MVLVPIKNATMVRELGSGAAAAPPPSVEQQIGGVTFRRTVLRVMWHMKRECRKQWNAQQRNQLIEFYSFRHQLRNYCTKCSRFEIVRSHETTHWCNPAPSLQIRFAIWGDQPKAISEKTSGTLSRDQTSSQISRNTKLTTPKAQKPVKAGGKPSTWSPPDGFVERFEKYHNNMHNGQDGRKSKQAKYNMNAQWTHMKTTHTICNRTTTINTYIKQNEHLDRAQNMRRKYKK